jgi:hypothetical protein
MTQHLGSMLKGSLTCKFLYITPLLCFVVGCGSNDYKYMCEGTMEKIYRGTINDGKNLQNFRDKITFSFQQGIWAAYHSAAGRFETRLGFSEKQEFETEVLVNLFALEIYRRSNPLRSDTVEERYTINRFTGHFHGYHYRKAQLTSDYLVGVEYNGKCQSI